MKNYRIGIDFGGTKTEIICLAANGKKLYRHRIPTVKGDYKKTLKSLTSLIKQAEKSVGRKGSIGIGIPGNICPKTGVIKGANTTWMVDKPFRPDLEKMLNRPIKVTNDANCFALSEAVDGAGAGHSVVFAAIIGTGCGAGISIDQKIIEGRHDSAGEWGHNPLPYPKLYSPESINKIEKCTHGIEFFTDDPKWNEYPGSKCLDCGRYGCLETWLSGPGMKRDYAEIYKKEISTHDIVFQAKQGDKNAIETLERYMDRLARALASIVNTLDPDIIVLGGGLSNVQDIYTKIPKIWGKYIYAKNVTTPVVQARHSDSSGVRGAAWLWG